jgi:hypothetical protein
MRQRSRWTAAILLALCLTLSGCQQASEEEETGGSGEARVDSLDGTGLKRVTLTQEAATRLGVETVPLRQEPVAPRSGKGGKQSRKLAPYAAVIYDVNGAAWVYTMPQPLSYVRQRVTVDHVEGDVAVLSQGPGVGTAVVTQGVAELYGTEIGVGTSE